MSDTEETVLPDVAERFIRYAGHDTSSDGSSASSPSTARQMDFLRMLREELEDLGMEDVELDESGTLYATLPGEGAGRTVIGLLAHVDTSPEAPGEGVVPVIHRSWDGGPIRLRGDVSIDPAMTEHMNRYAGGTIITSDGNTLLGVDDKAGVALIMEACRALINDPGIRRPPMRVAFTTDEEVGRGMDGFDAERFGADMAYTVDGGPVGKVDIQTFNAWSAQFRVLGREVHPGSAKGIMVNAVRIISDMVSFLRPEEMPENSSGDEGYIYPMHISSSTSEGTLRVILRDFTSDGMERKIRYMKSLEGWINSRYPGADITLELLEQYSNPAEILKRDRRAVDFALMGTRAAGLQPEESSIRGGTDGSRLSFMGVPTVNLPTGGEFYHSRKEWVAVEGLQLSLDILMETLKIWGGEQSAP
ncbi:MAG: peptidase T [Candidatus Fermentibacteraceae bacterium]|nr:peptidase T [Candidatus Fermentibacteraceae bacterium]MBN2607937.1 peptidase T [Candidatus Fermentibacteraceae bacterium]